MKNKSLKMKTNSFYKNALLVGIVSFSILGLSGAHAQGMMNRDSRGEMMRRDEWALERGQKNIVGTVTNINGNTLTLTQTIRSKDTNYATTTKVYTVDASSAKIINNGATSSISGITSGEMVSVIGTISGTNITAKIIHTGIPAMKEFKNDFAGNGQPVVEGRITSINGNTITITNNSNATYTIDATNAKIFTNGSTSSIQNLSVNNEVTVQGTVNGNNITAANIISHQSVNNSPKVNRGFFGRVKNFFGRFFGF